MNHLEKRSRKLKFPFQNFFRQSYSYSFKIEKEVKFAVFFFLLSTDLDEDWC